MQQEWHNWLQIICCPDAWSTEACSVSTVLCVIASCCCRLLINSSLCKRYAPRPEILGDRSCTSGDGYFRRVRLQLLTSDHYGVVLIWRLARSAAAHADIRWSQRSRHRMIALPASLPGVSSPTYVMMMIMMMMIIIIIMVRMPLWII